MIHVLIYWEKRSTPAIRARIRARFGISDYMSVNGETPADIKEEDMPVLSEVVRLGFITLRNKTSD